ncbi:hypothetical protein HDU97_006532 [Phlyctochytrium planicorne]|nr:hypothetical protein HDU97_006532 [Phlyctochytrium planicorne]
MTCYFGLTYIVYARFFPSGAKSYSKAFWGTILSYGIIIYKAHGTPQISKAYLQRIMMDENTQYLILSFIWLTSKPVWVVLIPFVTFSMFHSLNYFRTEVLIRIAPPGHSLHAAVTQRIIPNLLRFTQAYQSKALELVAYLEIWLIPVYLLLSALVGGASIVSVILFAQFLRFRYFFSALTRKAVADLKARTDGFVARPGMPMWVSATYQRAVELIAKWGDVSGGQAPAGAPPTAAPNGTGPR